MTAIWKRLDAISSSNFLYSNKLFVAEMSDFKGLNLFNRLYDDACDEGFVMKSEKTGKLMPFSCSREIINDNEIVGWEFSPADLKLLTDNIKVVIFND